MVVCPIAATGLSNPEKRLSFCPFPDGSTGISASGDDSRSATHTNYRCHFGDGSHGADAIEQETTSNHQLHDDTRDVLVSRSCSHSVGALLYPLGTTDCYVICSLLIRQFVGDALSASTNCQRC